MSDKEEIEYVKRETWEKFQKSGLLWWINRTLHLFGWAIVFSYGDEKYPDKLTEVYPARVKFRGFSDECETTGFKNLTTYLKDNAPELLKETEM